MTVGGQRMPYWQAPGHYAPFYAGGMFGGFGVPGLLFGSVIGARVGHRRRRRRRRLRLGRRGLRRAAADFGGGDFGGGDFGG